MSDVVENQKQLSEVEELSEAAPAPKPEPSSARLVNSPGSSIEEVSSSSLTASESDEGPGVSSMPCLLAADDSGSLPEISEAEEDPPDISENPHRSRNTSSNDPLPSSTSREPENPAPEPKELTDLLVEDYSRRSSSMSMEKQSFTVDLHSELSSPSTTSSAESYFDAEADDEPEPSDLDLLELRNLSPINLHPEVSKLEALDVLEYNRGLDSVLGSPGTSWQSSNNTGDNMDVSDDLSPGLKEDEGSRIQEKPETESETEFTQENPETETEVTKDERNHEPEEPDERSERDTFKVLEVISCFQNAEKNRGLDDVKVISKLPELFPETETEADQRDTNPKDQELKLEQIHESTEIAKIDKQDDVIKEVETGPAADAAQPSEISNTKELVDTPVEPQPQPSEVSKTVPTAISEILTTSSSFNDAQNPRILSSARETQSSNDLQSEDRFETASEGTRIGDSQAADLDQKPCSSDTPSITESPDTIQHPKLQKSSSDSLTEHEKAVRIVEEASGMLENLFASPKKPKMELPTAKSVKSSELDNENPVESEPPVPPPRADKGAAEAPRPPPRPPPPMFPLPRIVQRLVISPLQFKPFAGLLASPKSRVSIQIKLDDETVYHTFAVGANSSEKFTLELQRHHHAVRLSFIEHLSPYETRHIGRVTVTKKKLAALAENELVLPVEGSSNARKQISTVLGELCLRIDRDPSNANCIVMSVLDFTETEGFSSCLSTAASTKEDSGKRRGSTTSTHSLSGILSAAATSVASSSAPPAAPVSPLAACRGTLYASVCVTAFGDPLLPVTKLGIVNRRGTSDITFGSVRFAEALAAARIKFQQPSKDTLSSSSGGSLSSGKENSPGAASTSTSTTTTTTTTASPVRLNIALYADPSYREDSYVGFVRIPLNSETFFPIERSIGTHWYEIKSRMTIASAQPPQAPGGLGALSNHHSHHHHHHHLHLPHHQGGHSFFQRHHSCDGVEPVPSTSSATATGQANAPTGGVTTPTNGNNPNEKVGDLRIQFWYSVEHILSLKEYQPLYQALLSSFQGKPYEASLCSVLQFLNVEFSQIARPLMKIFLQNGAFPQFFRLVCEEYMRNTAGESSILFRSQSMTTKVMHEMMKFVGSDYLVETLKPLIDLVYAERKRCEVDGGMLLAGDNLRDNTRNIMVYAELAFDRVCKSADRCPLVLRQTLAALREVVQNHFGKTDTARLAVSSFIIMRFFAAAIPSPTQYGLKKKYPEPDVLRTLVLISKILQRLANCVVSQQPLTTKQPWLDEVLQRFLDDNHRQAMIDFFDAVSLQEPSSSVTTPGSDVEPRRKTSDVLKSGQLVNRAAKRSFKNFLNQRMLMVTLTEDELSWQKIKTGDSNRPPTRDVIQLCDITSITAGDHSNRYVFKVTTPAREVYFQALSLSDMTDWMVTLITHQRRCLFFRNWTLTSNKSTGFDNVDIEKELESLHMLLIENYETLQDWKARLDCLDDVDQVLADGADKFPYNICKKASTIEERIQLRNALASTLEGVIDAIHQIEDRHRITLAIQMQNMRNLKNDTSTVNGLTDNENYLLIHGHDKRLKTANLMMSHLKT